MKILSSDVGKASLRSINFAVLSCNIVILSAFVSVIFESKVFLSSNFEFTLTGILSAFVSVILESKVFLSSNFAVTLTGFS